MWMYQTPYFKDIPGLRVDAFKPETYGQSLRGVTSNDCVLFIVSDALHVAS